LTLLVKAAKDVGFEGKFYTFYGNAMGAPAAMGEAGVGKVIAVAEWFPNVEGAESVAFYQSFRQRFPKPEDDYVHVRMQLMVEALAKALEASGPHQLARLAPSNGKAGTIDAVALARALEGVQVRMAGQGGVMRAADHQFQQPLVVAVMGQQGQPGVRFDTEGSGFGFKPLKVLNPQQAEHPHTCQMQRP
jgi:branched-chain amino acid transport system substrate-binding protein